MKSKRTEQSESAPGASSSEAPAAKKKKTQAGVEDEEEQEESEEEEGEFEGDGDGDEAMDEDEDDEDEDEEEEEDEDMDDEDEDGEEEEEEERGGEEAIACDFDFSDPSEKYFHSVKALVGGLLDGKEFNVSELADSICEQGNIGNVVTADGEEDVVAVLTILNIRQYKLGVFREIRKHLSEVARRHADPGVKNEIERLLALMDEDPPPIENPKANATSSSSSSSKANEKEKDDRGGAGAKKKKKKGTERGKEKEEKTKGKEVGLLINERVLNLPPPLVAPLVGEVLKDVDWSLEAEEMPEDERRFYRFSHLIGVSKFVKMPGNSGSSSASSSSSSGTATGKEKGKGGDSKGSAPTEVVFPYLETEFFLKHSLCSFSWPINEAVSTKAAGVSVKKSDAVKTLKRKKEEGQPHRVVFVLEYEKLKRVSRDLKALVAQEGGESDQEEEESP
uniref:Protein BCCIP homolog n=1 Tax=Chromera velia CCMP2878 TaxID=1169474 RepID=A0A0G4HUC5_9ALVE|mmetsp:Transcript_31648/g.62617  ORF Transcript_31648/g.62617 Transcript_31648/m.62617 type:complete len:449 (-) Transcript_31648:163-1509(-)|eukprot:Cvel_8594.t1-p1 / transcript=Cvel_8594.t1 / gene=Cvel_8594 / organism=Chromera_velia_CCMP2878 / gene_product=Protein BCCIP homolog, putative / transcript_product=Protein BCCIP homolog, putative / location=Cvel_scaffold477:15528-23158(+) / protein_length=448 / sequence_SO=supercontig / SO=protein_coding / is_pseudo=false